MKKIVVALLFVAVMVFSAAAPGALASDTLTFTNTPLLQVDGGSEPARLAPRPPSWDR